MNLKEQNNNVTWMKFIAAIMVILSHSYPLTGNGTDFLSNMTEGRLGLGFIAVSVFFSFSGFYLSKSLEKNDNIFIYLKKRVKKIFPPLITVVLLSVFVIGPIFTTMSLAEYFREEKTYLYLLNALLIPVHELPGVFINAPYNSTINGSLWTLPVEFACYIFLIILIGIEKRFNKKIFTILFLILTSIICPIITVVLADTSIKTFSAAVPMIAMFCMGHFYWENKDRLIINKFSIFLEVMILLFAANSIFYLVIYIVCFPLFILSITSMNKKGINRFMSGEISYWIYLWGFPVGQILIELFSGMSVWSHFIGNVLIVLAIALLSEKVKKCCEIKKKEYWVGSNK